MRCYWAKSKATSSGLEIFEKPPKNRRSVEEVMEIVDDRFKGDHRRHTFTVVDTGATRTLDSYHGLHRNARLEIIREMLEGGK